MGRRFRRFFPHDFTPDDFTSPAFIVRTLRQTTSRRDDQRSMAGIIRPSTWHTFWFRLRQVGTLQKGGRA